MSTTVPMEATNTVLVPTTFEKNFKRSVLVNEDYSYEIKSIAKALFCSCGYIGTPVIITEQEYKEQLALENESGFTEMNHDPFASFFDAPVKEKTHFARGFKDVCPCCGKKNDLVINTGETLYDIDFVELYNEENKVSLSIGYTAFYYNRKVCKLGATHPRMRFTLNKETGITYLLAGKSIQNFTYGNTGNHRSKYAGIIDAIVKDELSNYKLKSFLNTCLESRGIKYYEPIAIDSDFDYGEMIRIMRDVFMVSRFPVLENVSTLSLTNTSEIPVPVRKALRSATSSNELYEGVYGITNKNVRKAFIKSAHNEKIVIVNKVVKDANIVKMFADLLNEDLYAPKERVLYPSFGGPFYSQDLPKETFIPTYADSFLNASAICSVYGHLNDDNANADAIALELGLQVLFEKTSSPATLVKRMFTTKVRRRVRDFANPGEFKNVVDEIHVSTMFSNITDIGRIVKEFARRGASHEDIPFANNNIMEYHDLLASELGKIEVPAFDFSYSENEVTHYTKTVNGFDFKLATNNHILTDIGNEMRICVGGYSDSVSRRNCYIVYATRQGSDKFELCIEINPSTGAIKQVKENCNQLPTGELAQAAVDYFNLVGVDYVSSYDMHMCINDVTNVVKKHSIVRPEVSKAIEFTSYSNQFRGQAPAQFGNELQPQNVVNRIPVEDLPQ